VDQSSDPVLQLHCFESRSERLAVDLNVLLTRLHADFSFGSAPSRQISGLSPRPTSSGGASTAAID
jgi:hypothetical protein